VFDVPTDAGSKLRPCVNAPGQTMSHKRLVIGRSGIHGWGAYALEAIEKNDHIYEYTGELISHVSNSIFGVLRAPCEFAHAMLV
jgi:SET domain-containing protein